MYIIIGGDGKEYGPVSGADLRQWISEGRVSAQSLAKAESDAEFRPLATFPEFAGLFAHATAGAPQTFSPTNLVERDYELDIGNCISRGWALVKNNFWPAIGVNALIFILIVAFNQITGLFTRPAIDAMIRLHQFSAGGIFILVLASILGAPVYMILMAGLLKYFLKL